MRVVDAQDGSVRSVRGCLSVAIYCVFASRPLTRAPSRRRPPPPASGARRPPPPPPPRRGAGAGGAPRIPRRDAVRAVRVDRRWRGAALSAAKVACSSRPAAATRRRARRPPYARPSQRARHGGADLFLVHRSQPKERRRLDRRGDVVRRGIRVLRKKRNVTKVEVRVGRDHGRRDACDAVSEGTPFYSEGTPLALGGGAPRGGGGGEERRREWLRERAVDARHQGRMPRACSPGFSAGTTATRPTPRRAPPPPTTTPRRRAFRERAPRSRVSRRSEKQFPARPPRPRRWRREVPCARAPTVRRRQEANCPVWRRPDTDRPRGAWRAPTARRSSPGGSRLSSKEFFRGSRRPPARRPASLRRLRVPSLTSGAHARFSALAASCGLAEPTSSAIGASPAWLAISPRST